MKEMWKRTDIFDEKFMTESNALMAAKMDQVREVVAVSSCAERGFGKKEWQRLHVSLVDWCDSIRTLLDVLKASRGA